MAKRNKEGAGGTGDDLVVVIVAPSLGEAEQFRELLEDHDIAAVVAAGEAIENVADALLEDVAAESPSGGVAVLVPKALLDEAGEIIADREEFEEFEDDETVDDDDGDDMLDAMEVDLEDWDSGGAPSPADGDHGDGLVAEGPGDDDDEVIFDDRD